MSFATETENLVEQLIQAEYKNACEIWGKEYASKQEACDVLDEEVREVGYEITELNYRNFDFIKFACQNKKLDANWVVNIEKTIKNAIKELAQVGAVVRKIRTTKDEEEE